MMHCVGDFERFDDSRWCNCLWKEGSRPRKCEYSSLRLEYRKSLQFLGAIVCKIIVHPYLSVEDGYSRRDSGVARLVETSLLIKIHIHE